MVAQLYKVLNGVMKLINIGPTVIYVKVVHQMDYLKTNQICSPFFSCLTYNVQMNALINLFPIRLFIWIFLYKINFISKKNKERIHDEIDRSFIFFKTGKIIQSNKKCLYGQIQKSTDDYGMMNRGVRVPVPRKGELAWISGLRFSEAQGSVLRNPESTVHFTFPGS